MEAAVATRVSNEDDYGDEWDAPPKTGICCNCEQAKYVNTIGQRGGRLTMTKWRGRNLCDTCRLKETRSNLDAKVRI